MYRSYCLTIRPLNGITDLTINEVVKFISKQEGCIAVTEKETNERHLHAQIWLEKPKARGDISKQLQRICERTIPDWDTSQLKVLRNGIRIAYSDWYMDYLLENGDKGAYLPMDHENIKVNKVPEQTMQYYPTEEEQNAVQILKNAVDPRFAKMELDFNEWRDDKDITLSLVALFIADSMFKSRTIKVIQHTRDKVALTQSLYLYVTKSTDTDTFLPKDKDALKIANFLSQHNLQGCPINEELDL